MKRLIPVLMGFALLLLSSTEGWCTSPSYHFTFTRGMTDSSGVSNFSGIDSRTVKPCPGSYGRTWTDCAGTCTWNLGKKYIGEFKNGRFHGQGTLFYSTVNSRFYSENNIKPISNLPHIKRVTYIVECMEKSLKTNEVICPSKEY